MGALAIDRGGAAGKALADIDPAADRAAVARAGADPERPRLQHDRVDAVCRQFQRRRQPGIAAADDRDARLARYLHQLARHRPIRLPPIGFGHEIVMKDVGFAHRLRHGNRLCGDILRHGSPQSASNKRHPRSGRASMAQRPVTERKKASDFPPELLNLFDFYVHGAIGRRAFLDGARKFAVGGVTAAALFRMLRPNYAWAIQVPPDDKRIKAESAAVPSPQGNGSIKGYLVRPANATKLPTILVVHENRGLNPYIEDVARRLAVADFIAFAPDGLTSVG